jgi:hypothetical protein
MPSQNAETVQKIEMKHAIVKRANMKIAEQIGKRNPRTQQMEKIGMNKCDLERGACEKKKWNGRNQCKLEGGDMTCGAHGQSFQVQHI